MALTPSVQTYQTWSTVADAAAWAGVKAELWKKVAAELGDEEFTSLMLLGGVADDDYRAATTRVASGSSTTTLGAELALQRSQSSAGRTYIDNAEACDAAARSSGQRCTAVHDDAGIARASTNAPVNDSEDKVVTGN